MSNTKSIHSTLNVINLQVDSNQGKAYIPWMVLWNELLEHYPKASYKFHESKEGFPYTNTPVGIFVKVSVTIEDITRTMTRPVYNNAMKSMKETPYEYTIKSGKKVVEGAVASDVNDALFRCLAKCIGMHSLGAYVFKKEMYAPADLLDSSQITEVSNLIAKNGLMLGEINAVYGINKLSELHSSNFDNVIGLIEKAIESKLSIADFMAKSNAAPA